MKRTFKMASVLLIALVASVGQAENDLDTAVVEGESSEVFLHRMKQETPSMLALLLLAVNGLSSDATDITIRVDRDGVAALSGSSQDPSAVLAALLASKLFERAELKSVAEDEFGPGKSYEITAALARPDPQLPIADGLQLLPDAAAASQRITDRVAKVFSPESKDSNACTLIYSIAMSGEEVASYEKRGQDVRLHCSGPHAAILQAIAALEQGTPTLFLSELTVFHSSSLTRQDSDLRTVKVLDPRFTLSGYVKPAME